MGIREEESRIQQILVESIKVLCRSVVTFKESLQIDGLVGIRVDNKEVLLVKIENAVGSDSAPVGMSSSLLAQDSHQDSKYNNNSAALSAPGSATSHVSPSVHSSSPSSLSVTHCESDNRSISNNTAEARHSYPAPPMISTPDRKRSASHVEDTAKTSKRTHYKMDMESTPDYSSLHGRPSQPASSTASPHTSTESSKRYSSPVWYPLPKGEAENAAKSVTALPPESGKTEDKEEINKADSDAQSIDAAVKHEDLERRLMDWVRDQLSRNIAVTHAQIRQKALEFYHTEKQESGVLPLHTHASSLPTHIQLNPLSESFRVFQSQQEQLLSNLVRASESSFFHGQAVHQSLAAGEGPSLFSLPVTASPQTTAGMQHVQPIGHVQPMVQPLLSRFQPVLGPVHAVEPTIRSEAHSHPPLPRPAFPVSPSEPQKTSPRKPNNSKKS